MRDYESAVAETVRAGEVGHCCIWAKGVGGE
jgi:hypothetical protein